MFVLPLEIRIFNIITIEISEKTLIADINNARKILTCANVTVINKA